MKDTVEKKESDIWNRFCTTGSVEDYLLYATGRGVKGTFTAGESVAGVQNELAGQAGDSPHAGFYSSDGNYIETDAYR